MKPLIGVVPLYSDERSSQWMDPSYLGAITAAGGLPVVLPLVHDGTSIRQLVDAVDGIVLTGGQDVDPELYGEAPVHGTQTCPPRDLMERALLTCCLEADKPVLGIGRGAHTINVLLGGSLYQDVAEQLPTTIAHQREASQIDALHNVSSAAGTPLRSLAETETMVVNSSHHQGIRHLATTLEPMAYADDGLIEAFWRPSSHFIWALQWHPEQDYRSNETSAQVFGAFIGAAREMSGEDFFNAQGLVWL